MRYLTALILSVVFSFSNLCEAANQNIKGNFQIPVYNQIVSGTSGQTLLIDAAAEKVAFVMQASETKSISKVGFRTGTVTTGATLDVRVETVSATDGNPTGTLWATTTNASQVVADANDSTWFTVTLTSNASLTVEDIFAVVIVNPSVSPGNMQIQSRMWSDDIADLNFPYIAWFTASWLQSSVSNPNVYVEYSDGTVGSLGVCPSSAVTQTSFNNASSADEIGNIFQFPFPVIITVIVIMMCPSANSTFDIVLYDSDGTTALQTVSIDPDQLVSNGTGRVFHYFRFANQALLINTNYRIVMKPTSANNLDIWDFTVNAALTMDAYDLGQNMYLTSRADAGSWTNTTTRRMGMALLLQGFDDAVCAGGASAYTYIGN